LIPNATDRIAQWYEGARGRPEWQLWGKAQPGDEAAEPAHPLLCHMLDVMAVAETFLKEILPAKTLERFEAALGLDDRSETVRWVCFLTGCHDLGKASPAFQAKWKDAVGHLERAGFDVPVSPTARDHATLTVPLLRDVLSRTQGLDAVCAERLARTVAAHHGSFPRNEETIAAPAKRERGASERWALARDGIVRALIRSAGVEETAARPAPAPIEHAFFVDFAGLVSVADWVGSAVEHFPYSKAPQSAEDYYAQTRKRAWAAIERLGIRRAGKAHARSFVDLFGVPPWPLHEVTERLASGARGPALFIVEAPMGEGKTEAALTIAERLAGVSDQAGFFVGLPTQATANQMVGRIKRFLETTHVGETANLQLVHGETIISETYQSLLRAVYDPKPNGGAVVAEQWFAKSKRALLAPYAVGTIDQALLGVLRVKHGFVRLHGLAGKTVILDEVHAYDTYTSTIIDRLLEWLRALGASVVILSATLPKARRKALVAAYGGDASDENSDYPRITVTTRGKTFAQHVEPRRPSKVITLSTVTDDVDVVGDTLGRAMSDGGCAGWICNSISRAQAAYRALAAARKRGALAEGTRLLLLHSRLPSEDRQEREKLLERWLGRHGDDRPERAVVVGTQVLEQSLDVDFDVLATDVAPIDLVLQRAGRLHRHDRQRPDALTTPTLYIVHSPGPPLEVPLQGVASVYEPAIMRKTLLTLASRNSVRVPTEIEPLVEAVYGDAPTLQELAGQKKDLDDRRWRDEVDAKTRLIPRPTGPDDFLGDLEMPFDDDNPDLHEALRAKTRLGDPSADVVCLFRRGDRTYFDRQMMRPVSLETPPTREVTLQLLRRGAGVSHRGVTPLLLALPSPAPWQRSAILRNRRVLAFESGLIPVGNWTISLDDELGLVISQKGATVDA
jgi:CRISPR-associated endonuclease/helicase Cas3